MPVFYFVFILAMVVVDMSGDVSRDTHSSVQTTQASSLGANMLIVRNGLERFVKVNPSTSGEVTLEQLGLPEWFEPNRKIRTWIENGRLYIYYTPIEPVYDLSTMLGPNLSAQAGIAHDGALFSPSLSTSTPLPSTIPNNSIVLML